MIRRCILFTGAAALASTATAAPDLRLERLETVDVPALTQEIVHYSPRDRLLAVTDPFWKTLDLYRVAALGPPRLEPLDFNEDEDGPQGVPLIGEPTSVAVDPNRPLAYVSMLGRHSADRGWVLAVGLGPGEVGRTRRAWRCGFHPDALALSPDGRWLLVANEGEGHPDTPGEIGAFDLQGWYHQTRGAAAPPYRTVGDLGALFRESAGDIEPEFIAWTPTSGLFAVSCQDNDAVVIGRVGPNGPELTALHFLGYGADPDGVALIDGVPGPQGRPGALLAVAEEGRLDRKGVWKGLAVSLWWIDPAAPGQPPLARGRLAMTEFFAKDFAEGKLRNPESVALARWRGHVLLFAAIEHGDRLGLWEVSDPDRPRLIDFAKVGDRPEGIEVVEEADRLIIITGDEGNDGPGTLTFLQVTLR